jgi:PKD repeat protein
MRRKKEKADGGMKFFSIVMIGTIALSVCVGIVALENGSSLSMSMEAAQDVTGTEGGAEESFTGNVHFEMKVPPAQDNERLKVSQKEKVGISQEEGRDILLPMISKNKIQGLRVFSFTRNFTGEEVVRNFVNVPQDNETKNMNTPKTAQKTTENQGINEETMTDRKITEELKSRPYLKPKVDNSNSILSPAMATPSIEEPSSELTITIQNETAASGEWLTHAPGEFAAHIPFEHEWLEKNIKGLEKGMEDLFLQDVQNIKITEGDETLLVTFNLKGNYTNSFVTGKCRYTYELATYAPVGLHALKIVIPGNKTLLSVNPGPNEMKGNEFIYYDYNWVDPIEIYYDYAETEVYKGAATIGDVWTLSTLPVISIETFGTNEYSRFCIPSNWSGWGSDPVPGTGYTALQVAEIYKPKLYNRADQCQDAVYYRVVKGYDPYAGFEAYLILYFGYWRCQDPVEPIFAHHEHDYEPIFIWVKNIGEKPYRVAYDYYGGLTDNHMHEIHRTYLWTDPLFEGEYKMPSGVYAQHKAYYPFGISEYDQLGWDDIAVWNLSTSLQDNWDGNYVKLGIANDYHTYDTDISGTYCGDYLLSPLTDEQLITWYRKALDDNNPCDVCDCDLLEHWEVVNFRYDISDPFYGVFWEDCYGLAEHEFPTLSATINDAEMNMSTGTLTVNVSAYYDNHRAGGGSGWKLMRGLWKDRFYMCLIGEGLGRPPKEAFTAKEYSAGNYTLQFDDLPLGTYELWVGVGDNVHKENENYWYWTKAEDKITIEFGDDFEDPDFSLDAWVSNNGEWSVHVNESGNNYLWTTAPAADGYDPIMQLKGTSDWTDYTVETDFAFIDTGTEGAAAYIIGRDSIQIGETHPYGGSYIASVQIEKHGGEWKGNATVQRAYDANGDGSITQDELTLLAIENLNSDIVSDLVNHSWCTLKVGFEGSIITVYVKSPSTGENLVLSMSDSWLTKGDIGLGASEAEGTTIKAAFDNVRASKGCIFNDQFENIRFSEGAWLVSNSTDCYITDIDGNGVMVIDDPAGEGPYAYVDQDFGTKSVVVEGVFNVSEDNAGQSHASVEIAQNKGASYSLLYGFNAKTDDETFILYWYDTETSEQGSAYKSYSFSSNQWYNFKLVIDNDNNMMYAYMNNKLELELDLPGCTGNISRVLLWDKYAKVLWDNIYVEQTPTDTTPPTVAITSPGPGDTVSGVFTVETTVTDTGGSGINHSVLYANDTLVAVNTSSSSDNPIFKLDTATLDSGDCTLTVVAVDNAMNSNWTAITVDVNKLPVANFTYTPDNPTTADTITFDASSSYDPDGTITSYDWDFGDGNTSSGVITTHRYTTNGTYTVNLTVTDDDGATDSTLKIITVVTAITTCEDLQNMTNNLSRNYYLANDIDCSCTASWNSGAGFEPIGNYSNPFTGTFDGQGYTITDLFINRPATGYVGLFGYTGSGSEIKNVGLENISVRGHIDVGGLVGHNEYGTISNSSSTGSVSSSDNKVGGLVGYNKGTIGNSYSSSSVNSNNHNQVGGLVGLNGGTINNSYSTGSVSGNVLIGGLVGDNHGTINNSYSAGSVSGNSWVGGLVGLNCGGTINNSYWDIETSGQSTSDGGEGKTTTEMKQQATFVGWDFDNIWAIEEDVTYPFLQWQDLFLFLYDNFTAPDGPNVDESKWCGCINENSSSLVDNWYFRIEDDMLTDGPEEAEYPYTIRSNPSFTVANDVSLRAEVDIRTNASVCGPYEFGLYGDGMALFFFIDKNEIKAYYSHPNVGASQLAGSITMDTSVWRHYKIYQEHIGYFIWEVDGELVGFVDAREFSNWDERKVPMHLEMSRHDCYGVDGMRHQSQIWVDNVYVNGEMFYASPPGCSIVINNDADYTMSREVILTSSAEDSDSGVVAMRFANDNKQTESWSVWLPYSTTFNWTVSEGYGEKKVYVKYKNGEGLESLAYYDGIVLAIPANITIKPETLNLDSKGEFTASITLPEQYTYDITDINISTVECEGAHAIAGKIKYDKKLGVSKLKVKFNTQDLVGMPTGDAVTLTVIGKVIYNGGEADFEGCDTIRVI